MLNILFHIDADDSSGRRGPMRNDHTGHMTSSTSNEHARHFESDVMGDEFYDEDDSEIFLLPGRDVPVHSHGNMFCFCTAILALS